MLQSENRAGVIRCKNFITDMAKKTEPEEDEPQTSDVRVTEVTWSLEGKLCALMNVQ